MNETTNSFSLKRFPLIVKNSILNKFKTFQFLKITEIHSAIITDKYRKSNKNLSR